MGIARALLSRAEYMIFDEATSSVDPQSEKEIWETIGHLAESRTLIIISHRMSSVQNADCIYVLRDGRVAQHGPMKPDGRGGTLQRAGGTPAGNGGGKMKRKFSYSMKEMNYRLLMMGRPIWKYIGISTLASTLGALSHMGLMGFGALWLLAAAGFCDGAGIYAALTAVCAVLIAVCRYLEGVFSHLGAYGILAKMRVHLFDAIDRIAPAYLIGRKTGDVMNIAVSDIETLEYFFAHTIGRWLRSFCFRRQRW